MKSYIGKRDEGRAIVTVEEDGIAAPLAHHVRHSPNGFNWGYGGSGPAELARCILIDYYGKDAYCWNCGGNGSVGPKGDRERCPTCSGEKFILPVSYQAFKFAMIAPLDTQEGWVITSRQISKWVRENG